MPGEAFLIGYTFETGDGATFGFPVALDAARLLLRLPERASWPEWTQLAHCQCPGCPLDPAAHAHCPAALGLVGLIEAFGPMISYGTVRVSVEMHDRTVSKDTTMQRGLSSILGLCMATSGCPHLDFLRPLARFHQPFATREETLFRATSAYLLGQYFQRFQGSEGDFAMAGLKQAYERLQLVNVGMARRIRTIAEGDANVNALILLDLLAKDLPMAIEENLSELAHLFAGVPAPQV
jgi:hypothetical protein